MTQLQYTNAGGCIRPKQLTQQVFCNLYITESRKYSLGHQVINKKNVHEMF